MYDAAVIKAEKYVHTWIKNNLSKITDFISKCIGPSFTYLVVDTLRLLSWIKYSLPLPSRNTCLATDTYLDICSVIDICMWLIQKLRSH